MGLAFWAMTWDPALVFKAPLLEFSGKGKKELLGFRV